MKDLITEPNKTGLSGYSLKIIAIFTMLIDHIAWAFVPTGSVLGQIMHLIGRLTAPIMCYFIAEGYHHTSNLKRYTLRLGIFAIISHIPFYYFMNGQLPITLNNGIQFKLQTSVMYTLFLGLMSLIVWNHEKLSKTIKIILIFGLCIIATPGDWSFIAVLWILFFGINTNNFKKQIWNFIAIASPVIISPFLMFTSNNNNWYYQIFQIGILLAIPILKQYNGKPGGSKNSKWIFYIFYPLHLLIIGIIKYGF